MMRFHLLLAVAMFAVGLAVAGTHPAHAISITLKVVDPVTGQDRLGQRTGQPLNLIATTDQNVSPPYFILIYDAFGAFIVQGCQNVSACTATVVQNTPTINVAYIAYVAQFSAGLFPPDIQATSNEVNPSWLNPMKLYVARLPVHNPNVFLISDNGGAVNGVWAPFHILIFNKTTGALVRDCPGGTTANSGLTECVGGENNPSDSMYWAVIALPSTSVGTLQDAREGSYYKCVDSIELFSPPTCTGP